MSGGERNARFVEFQDMVRQYHAHFSLGKFTRRQLIVKINRIFDFFLMHKDEILSEYRDADKRENFVLIVWRKLNEFNDKPYADFELHRRRFREAFNLPE